MSKSILRPRADFIQVLDACYAKQRTDLGWARDISDAVSQTLHGARVGVMTFEHDEECLGGRTLMSLRPPDVELPHDDAVFSLGPRTLRDFFYPPGLVMTQSKALRDRPVARARVATMRGGYPDAVAIVVHPEPRIAFVVYAMLEKETSLTHHDRTRLAQLGLHLESAFRLRHRPETVRAIFDAKGTLIERSDVTDDARVRASVKRVAAARASRDLDLWTALVNGEVSVVSRMQGSRRVYMVLDNAHASRPFRALTPREVDVLATASRGMPAKLCGYALGLSSASISLALANAAAKVGVASRLELLRLAALLTRDPRAEMSAAALTAAEQDVVALLDEGLSNSGIAARRGRSVRTIANQVAAILRKTGSTSRRALITRRAAEAS